MSRGRRPPTVTNASARRSGGNSTGQILVAVDTGQGRQVRAVTAIEKEGDVITKGLLVPLEAKPGNESELEEFLLASLPLVEEDAETVAWFAVRSGPTTRGDFQVFLDDVDRKAQRSGQAAKALVSRASELCAQPPDVQEVDVLAAKMPY